MLIVASFPQFIIHGFWVQTCGYEIERFVLKILSEQYLLKGCSFFALERLFPHLWQVGSLYFRFFWVLINGDSSLFKLLLGTI